MSLYTMMTVKWNWTEMKVYVNFVVLLRRMKREPLFYTRRGVCVSNYLKNYGSFNIEDKTNEYKFTNDQVMVRDRNINLQMIFL